ncbi:MAG: prepilin-type N-terminal cleavage/methylation domain-containing protein [Planctomycetota bacterium]
MPGSSILRIETRPNGFTLVELIIIVAVLAIMAAMVVPRIGQADSSKLRMAAQQLAADLQLIQNEAMAHGDQIRTLDWHVGSGLGYTLMNEYSNTGWGDADHSNTLRNNLTNRLQKVEFGVEPYEHLEGVWLAKANLNDVVSYYDGLISFGRYGQVLEYDFNPAMVLAAGKSTLRIEVDRDTGETTIDSDFGRLSDLDSITLPGDTRHHRTNPNPPD